MWLNFFQFLFTQFKEPLFESQETLMKHVFLGGGKVAFTHLVTFQPCYLIPPK